MGGVFTIVFMICQLVLFSSHSFSHPLCTDSRAPFTQTTPLAFCQYNGSLCCNSTDDLRLQNQFSSMHISDSGCASLLKSIICSKCDKFSAELFQIKSEPRSVPRLCNSTVSGANDFCSLVWDKCHNLTMSNSPFEDSTTPNHTSKLTDIWQSKHAFCNKFGTTYNNESICFNGGPVSLNNAEIPSPPNGMCLEKIANGSYLNMAPHPDGSDRVFLSDQPGKIWLATIPEEGSGEILGLDELNPFLDLTDEVYYESAFGMMGIAFHPDFKQNGRFFASFNCDKVKWPECSGMCSCNSEVGCEPSKLVSDNGTEPCRYHSVIAEFTANGTASQPFLEKNIKPLEVRRIFTMGLPFTSQHGGQILFGPEDGYLYYMLGYGGSAGDPYNFSQNKKSLLGKIMRLDIDNIPSSRTISELGLWGDYSVPLDNPFSEDKELRPEIWALGLRNPWRCSFDSERPSYFLCADQGQDQYEEVNIVTKGGNYGWRVYEGPFLYNPPQSPGGNTSARSISPIFPVMGYSHSDVGKAQGPASITGGYFYRSMTDPCMYGSYIFGDMYGVAIWAGIETPKESGNFSTSKIPVSCAQDSPIKCSSELESSLAALGIIFSFGEDNRKNMFLLASNGVYRVVRPSRCNYTCSKENVTAVTPPRSAPHPPPPGSSFANRLRSSCKTMLLFLSCSLLLRSM